MFCLGLSTLGSINNKYSEPEQIKKVLKILELGINKVDTADSYASTNSEKVLSKILAVRPDLLVTSKVGGYLSNLPRPFNEILIGNKIYQKYTILKNCGYFDFDPRIKPQHLEKHLINSLKRLKISNINTYLLHGVPKANLLDDFVDCLQTLKNKGLTANVGISADQKVNFDLSWCDEILTPAHLVRSFNHLSAKLSIHGLFHHTNNFSHSLAREFINSTSANSILLGSYNADKFVKYEKILQKI